MSKFVSIELPQSEVDKFERWTKTISEENKREVQRLVVNTGYTMKRRMMMFAPVRTAFLKSGFEVQFSQDKLGFQIYNIRSYSPYPEFGTGTKVVAPADVRDYAMTFKGKGKRKVNLRAQPYFFPAVRLGYKEMMMRLNELGFK